jgi:Tol biopolymer transport system component
LTYSWDGEGNREIYVINADGGLPQRLTTTPGENPKGSENPSWSRNGRWILFDQGGQVCKVPSERGPVVKVAHVDGYIPFESPDGKYIYYMTYLEVGDWISRIYRIPAEGGKAEHILDACFDAIWPVDDGIYFIPRPEHANDYSIQFLNTATGRIQRIATFEKQISSFTVSPDRRWILYRQIEKKGKAGSDLMLVENFR